jgi:exodeoxyribonuclease V gamma subunit
MPDTPIPTGLVALHGNRAETLADTLTAWLQRQPLQPLESEVVLVQSNGMAEWIKIALAQHSGICAAAQVELPSRFMWRTCRQVLGPEQVPRESPLDKLPLTWRFMDLLPRCMGDAVFAPVMGFLQGDEPDRLLQLASRLADLFDQYQIYRPDWLQDWAEGRDVCRTVGMPVPLQSDQAWQAELWRRVLATLSDSERAATRPALHHRVLAHLRAGHRPVQPVARRVSVFGMSHMPLQLLELLAALADHSQVLLAVPNPCRHHWGDIMDGREWLRSAHQRQRQKNKDRVLADTPLAQMHLHAPTLLAAWGRQGRDFVRLLDGFDDAQAACERAQLPTLDFFDDAPIQDGSTMLTQLQRRIRDLLPSTADVPAAALPAQDGSVLFRVAHSPVRELEVLHDQLLDWFAQPPGASPLSPRDVVVMVPDIERVAPAIDAVFGQYARSDARHIPFAIADLGAQAASPLIHAVEWLLTLPQERAHMSDLVALLEVPALARRFGVDEAGLPVLTRWMAGSGIRWGLSGEHRAGLGLEACGDVNSALFGVQRMLMGYACGADPVPQDSAVMPYAEVGGLDAELAGALAQLLQVLIDWWQQVQDPTTPAGWAERVRKLLTQCFEVNSDAERQALQALLQAIDDWLRACESAGFDASVPLAVARQAWLQALRVPHLEQRFRAGGVTFCTLMPMRAIPFRVVCLLGMNDGDYPRRSPQADFDLMALPGMARAGDRSRRDDDRQLMLEALLSARDVLYVSWCGHSVRDNSEQPPSVLVSQLRDEIDLLWGQDTAAGLTVSHPLQPFGSAYFTPDSGVSTYAHEWASEEACPAWVSTPDREASTPVLPTLLAANGNPPVITLAQLARFLRRPVGTFFRERLQVHLDPPETGWLDEELFGLGGLDQYSLLSDALDQVPPGLSSPAVHEHAQAVVQRLRASGALPLAGVGLLEAGRLQAVLQAVLQAALDERVGHTCDAPRVVVDLAHTHVRLQDTIAGLWQAQQALPLRVLLRASKVANVSDKNGVQALPDKLIDAWLMSLAAAAMGQPVRVVLVGRNAVVRAPILSRQDAHEQLQMLLQTWVEGLCSPLPLPPALALAWLGEPEVTEAMRQAYEDGGYAGGTSVARQDPALYRCYPTLDALLADGRFQALAARVYGPLLAWAGQCTGEPLADPVVGEDA